MSFQMQAYNKKELAALYKVSLRTFKRWLRNVPELGHYVGRCFTPAQVQKIIDHLGTP